MMLLLGLLGMVQALVLPGLLLWRAVFHVHSRCLMPAAIMGLSLMVNYLLAWVLVALACYTQKVMLALFFLELALLAVLLLREGARACTESGADVRDEAMPAPQPAQLVAAILVLLLFVYAVVLMLPNVGKIFGAWDAVASWNRWGVSWASNTFPEATYHYPQLVPILISVPYVFMNDPAVQFFSYSQFLFFLPLAILLCASLQRWREFAFPALLLAAGLLIWFFQKNTIFMGYADFPVLFFDLLSLVALLLWSRAGADPGDRMLLLSVVFAAGAPMTKQAGVFWLLLLPFAIRENVQTPWSRGDIRRFCGFFLLLLALAAAWYVYIEIQISLKRASSEIYYVTTSIYRGRSFFERWLVTLERWPYIWCLWLAALSGLAVRRMRVITLMGLSYTLCWSIFFSYSLRNLAIAIPFLSWSAALGLETFFERVRRHFCPHASCLSKNPAEGRVAKLWRRFSKCRRQAAMCVWTKKRQLLAAVALGVLCLAIGCGISSARLTTWLTNLQKEKAMSFGSRELNLLLAKTMRERKLPIVTIYNPAYTHPDIGYGGVVYAYGIKIKSLLSNPKIRKPCYLLFSDASRVQELENLSRDLPLHKLGSAGSYVLYLAE